MEKKRLDKLGLRLAEIEAKKVIEIRHLIVQECLDHCSKEHPYCPYLKPTGLCSTIQNLLDETVPQVLEDIGKDN